MIYLEQDLYVYHWKVRELLCRQRDPEAHLVLMQMALEECSPVSPLNNDPRGCATYWPHLPRNSAQYIDPMTIEPLMASCLIPLHKGEGAMRPIRVVKGIRRTIRKCVMNIAKKDVIEDPS